MQTITTESGLVDRCYAIWRPSVPVTV